MTTSLLEGVEKWLNTFTENGTGYSPMTLVEGRCPLRGDINRIPYGAYTLVYSGTDNTLSSRTVPAIALRESNGDGGHYFMSLKTGKRIHGNKWTRLEVTVDVINTVHALAVKGNQPWIHEDPFTTDLNDQVTNFSQNVINTVENSEREEDVVVEENVSEIEERTRATIEHLDNQSTESDGTSDDQYLSDDYSSGTTIEASDSTYTPGTDVSAVIEESRPSSPSFTINSEDFSFNVANVYNSDDSTPSQSEDVSEEISLSQMSSSSSDSELDTPIIDLINERI